MGAPVVWFEVLGDDVPALRAFYTDVFGWQVEDNPVYSSVEASAERGIPGGIGSASAFGGTPHQTFYVAVPDLAGTIATVEGRGGQVAFGPVPIQDGAATVAFVTDPEGHRIGLIQYA